MPWCVIHQSKCGSAGCNQQEMQPGDPPEILAQAMHIKLVVVVAPDGGIVGPFVDVHCMGQGMIATSSLHHLQRSAAYEEQYRSSMHSRGVVIPLCNLQPIFLFRFTSNNAQRQCVHSIQYYYHTIFHSCLIEVKAAMKG